MGGSNIGMPVFTIGRSPYVSYGVTALNPDVMDIFVEDIKQVDGKEMYFDAKEQNYKEFEI